MMKLWIKIISNEKILRDTIIQGTAETAEELRVLLTEACNSMNCHVPIVTRTDAENLIKFNHIKFLPADFVDKTDFDFLEIVHIKEKKNTHQNQV